MRTLLSAGLAMLLAGSGAPDRLGRSRHSSGRPNGPSAAADTEKIDTSSTNGWLVTDFAGKTPEGAGVSVSGKTLSFRYRRGVLSVLAHPVLLTELTRLTISLRSEKGMTLVLAMEDRDGATFHYGAPLAGGRTERLTVRPDDFRINDDSPVKKTSVDPKRLGSGLALFDLSAVTGGSGENVLELESIEVERSAIPRLRGDLVVEQALVLSESVYREGDILIRKGARLTVTAPRVTLRGNIRLEDGVLEILGGAFALPQRFNHELSLTAVGASRVVVRDALFLTAAPLAVNLGEGSALEVQNVALEGGFTCAPDGKARIRLERAKGMAEIIVPPGLDLSVADSKQVILWLSAGRNLKGKLTLPPGENVKEWKPREGWKARVTNSSVLWCLVSEPGSDGSVESTELYGVGLLFAGNTAVALRDLHNGRPLKSYAVAAPDRKLRFSNSKVTAWNYYAAEKARVQVERSTFGEALAFGEGRITIRDSECDGSGGYVGAQERSEIRVANSQIRSLVVAKDDATIVLEKCRVSGDVRATGRGTVRLIGSTVEGRVVQDPGARIIRE